MRKISSYATEALFGDWSGKNCPFFESKGKRYVRSDRVDVVFERDESDNLICSVQYFYKGNLIYKDRPGPPVRFLVGDTATVRLNPVLHIGRIKIN